MPTITLTPAQFEQVEWALEPMADLWCTPDGAHARDGLEYGEHQLPKLLPDQAGGGFLTLSGTDEINGDLLYRLEVQLPDMERGVLRADRAEAARARRATVAGQTVAKKIRATGPTLHNLPLGGGWLDPTAPGSEW